jgi:hypothetical protein
MESGQRMSGWSRLSLGFGVVWFAIAVPVAIAENFSGQPWWEETDTAKASEALHAGVSRAVTLIALSTGACLVGTLLGLVGIGQCWRSMGQVVGVGQACAGMVLTNFAATVMFYAAMKLGARPNPWVFIAVPTALTGGASWIIWRLSPRLISTLAAKAAAKPGVLSDQPLE